MTKILYSFIILLLITSIGCAKIDNNANVNNIQCVCLTSQMLEKSRGNCTETLTITPTLVNRVVGNRRFIQGNTIPNHKVGKFGAGQGSLGPNPITPQLRTYVVSPTGIVAGNLTPLLSVNSSRTLEDRYSFGVLLNGIELDPIEVNPFPHKGIMDPNINWDWNLEALNTLLGLDCNNAHVQGVSGKYHYHGVPTLYLDEIKIQPNVMTLIGYAADGFPIYYKYAYSIANDITSPIVEMKSGYVLKTGKRPGNGVTAPCDTYNGLYSNDYEYVSNSASGTLTLDATNGRIGITPEYPSGTYYYVITDEYPVIPRHFRGTPSTFFKM